MIVTTTTTTVITSGDEDLLPFIQEVLIHRLHSQGIKRMPGIGGTPAPSANQLFSHYRVLTRKTFPNTCWPTFVTSIIKEAQTLKEETAQVALSL